MIYLLYGLGIALVPYLLMKFIHRVRYTSIITQAAILHATTWPEKWVTNGYSEWASGRNSYMANREAIDFTLDYSMGDIPFTWNSTLNGIKISMFEARRIIKVLNKFWKEQKKVASQKKDRKNEKAAKELMDKTIKAAQAKLEEMATVIEEPAPTKLKAPELRIVGR